MSNQIGLKKVVFAAVAACGITLARSSILAADLPSGFMELPYIESDGNQWIATTYTPLYSDRVEFSFRMLKFTDWSTQYLFGSFGTANNKDSFILSYYGKADGRRIQTWNGDWALENGPYLEVGIDYDVVFDSGKRSFSINGETMPTRGTVIFTAQSPFILFGGHTAGSAFDPETTTITDKTMYRLYSFKVFDKDGNLKCDLVPAYDANATSGVTRFGVYDTVSRAFFKNRGTASFTTDPAFRIVHVVDRAAYGSDEEAGVALVSLLKSDVGSGDIVKLTAGTAGKPAVYSLPETAVLPADGVKLVGGSDDPAATVIDGAGLVACVYTAKASCRVEGLTVRNGFSSGGANATVFAGGIGLNGVDGVVSNCVVSGCATRGVDAKLYGGGVYLNGATLVDSLVKNCTVSNDFSGSSDASGEFYGGGVYGENGADVRRCEICGCVGYNDQNPAKQYNVPGTSFGGGLAISGNGTVASDCFVHDNTIVTGPTGYAQGKKIDKNFGAGVGVIDGAELQNSLVRENVSDNSAAGVYLKGTKSRAVGCTIVRNTVNNSQNTTLACVGISMNDATQSIRDCLIEGNTVGHASDSSSSAGGGAGIATSGEVSGCVIRENKAYNASGLKITGAVTVSNSVFSANGATDIAASAVFVYNCSGAMVRDCWFVRNTGATEQNAGSGLAFDFRNASNELKVRNCFFSDNCTRYVIGGTADDNAKTGAMFEVENCTFVRNAIGMCVAYCGQMNWDHGVIGKTAPVQHFTNCAFHDNNGKPAFGARYGTLGTEVHIDNCYDSTALSAGGYMPEGHNNLTVNDFANPGYKDPTNDDWSLKSRSGLRDKGAATDWMGDGSKTGVQDMGDGTWTETPASTIVVRGKAYDVGVVVTRNNAHPRLYGNAIDIGCSEFAAVSGLTLLFW